MNYFTYFLGLSAVFLSLFGYMTFFHEKFNVSPAFTPVLAVSSVTVLLYLLGFTGFLGASSIVLYILGMALLTRSIFLSFKGGYDPIKFILSPGIVAFCLISVFFILRCRGMSVLHVDNFSHWATAIKDMCLTDSYPKLSGAVTFRNYTPGATVFIYHVCRAVSFSESHALMAQGIMIAACGAVLFCKASFKRPVAFVAVITVLFASFAAFSLEGASLGIYNLTVDGLLAYVAAAGGVAIFAHRRDFFRCSLLLFPLTVWLSLIKSSGKIFSLLLIIFVFALFFRDYFKKTTPKRKLTLSAVCAGTLGINLLLPLLWDLYSDIVFKGYQNKFPTGLGVLSSIGSKDPKFLKSVFKGMMEELIDISSPTAQLLTTSLIFAVGVLILTAVFKTKGKFMIGVCLTSASVLIFYIAELFILYGFIFSEAEASILASFYRYFGTLEVLLSLILLTASIYTVDSFVVTDGKAVLSYLITSAYVLCMAIMSLNALKDNLILLAEPYRDEVTVDALEKREYFKDFYSGVREKIPPDSFVIVYTEKTDFFTSTLPQYELRTTHCMFIYPYFSGFPEIAESRLEYPDYFVVESGGESFKSLAASYGYTVVGDGTVYEVNRDTKVITVK